MELQVFPFSQQTLHNITETAPETWDANGFYDEKSDLFSFAVILWRVFGSKSQYTERKDDSPDDDGDDEYAFLRENGRPLPPPRQREIIKKVH